MQFVMSACCTLKLLHGTYQPEVCNWGEVRAIAYETARDVADASKQLDVPQNCPCFEECAKHGPIQRTCCKMS